MSHVISYYSQTKTRMSRSLIWWWAVAYYQSGNYLPQRLQLTVQIVFKIKNFDPWSGQTLSVQFPLVHDALTRLSCSLAQRDEGRSNGGVETESSSYGATESSVCTPLIKHKIMINDTEYKNTVCSCWIFILVEIFSLNRHFWRVAWHDFDVEKCVRYTSVLERSDVKLVSLVNSHWHNIKLQLSPRVVVPSIPCARR